jgi:hypothetical protein
MTRNSCLPLLVGLTLLSSAKAAEAQVQGGGTPRQVPVWIDGSTLGDSVITQDVNTNNIGIGTVAPSATLTVVGAGAFDAVGAARFDLFNSRWGDGFLQHVTDNGIWQIASMNTGATRMVIGPNGNVGIGTLDIDRDTLSVNGGGRGFDGVFATGKDIGVWGFSNIGTGVAGVSNSGPGVYGQSTSGHAGFFSGTLAFSTLGSPGVIALCWNQGGGEIANCSSSLRYKTDVRPFSSGLDIVQRLRPIAFNWKQDGLRDVGLAAEDVAEIEPLLTFRNDKGEIEGVKYNQLSAVFVNAFIEQQAQIKKQQGQIDALKALVCESHPDADVCR